MLITKLRRPGSLKLTRPLGAFRNIAFTYAVTGVDLLYLATTVLVFPKIVGKTIFAEYRLLILYAGYAGFLHLGLLNGFYQESLHCDSMAGKLALFRKVRRLLLGLLIVLAPLGTLVFRLLNPTASVVTSLAIMISWFLLNGQTLHNYAAQSQGRFDRFFAYNGIGRCAGLLLICLIVVSGNTSASALSSSFLLPIAVAVFVAEYFLRRSIDIAETGTGRPGGDVSVALQWRSCAHLYAANVFASLALSADKIVIASQFTRKIFADYSFAFSLSTLVLYAGDGLATATLPLLLRAKASEGNWRQSQAVWFRLYWLAPFAFWPAAFFINRWYLAYISAKSFLMCFSAVLPAIIYCKSYCGSSTIASKMSHLQSRVNFVGLAIVAVGIGAARYYSGNPLTICGGWCVGIFGWAALSSWALAKNKEARVKTGLHVGLAHVALSATAFGLGCYATRYGDIVGGITHGMSAAFLGGVAGVWKRAAAPV